MTLVHVTPMRVVRAPVEEERLTAANERAAALSHLDVVTPKLTFGQIPLKWKDRLRGKVFFSHPTCSLACTTEQRRKRNCVTKTRKMISAVNMSVSPVCVIVQTREYNRTTGSTGSRCAKRVVETNAGGGQCVQVRRVNGIVPVAPDGLNTVIIGNDKDNIRSSARAVQCMPSRLRYSVE